MLTPIIKTQPFNNVIIVRTMNNINKNKWNNDYFPYYMSYIMRVQDETMWHDIITKCINKIFQTVISKKHYVAVTIIVIWCIHYVHCKGYYIIVKDYRDPNRFLEVVDVPVQNVGKVKKK